MRRRLFTLFPALSLLLVRLRLTGLWARICTCAAAMVLGAAGCAPKIPPVRQAYYGPTEPMSQVVAAINANNRRLPTLYASIDSFAIWRVDEKGEHYDNGDGGGVLLRKPRDLLVRGDKLGVGTILRIGSNSERYWLVIPEKLETIWWGYWRNLGKPCLEEMPIRPDMILEVLGIGDVEADFNTEPVPLMRFDPEADQYVLIWSRHLPDRWTPQKEIRYDRQTKRPALVLLYDDNGRIQLRAELSDYRAVDVAGVPTEQRPVMASRFFLFFPETKSRVLFQLSDMAIEHKGIQNDRAYQFPDVQDLKQIQIDRQCDQ